MRSWLNLIENTNYLGRIGSDSVNKFIDLKIEKRFNFWKYKRKCENFFQNGQIILFPAFVK
jgi:hypothetical protein